MVKVDEVIDAAGPDLVTQFLDRNTYPSTRDAFDLINDIVDEESKVSRSMLNDSLKL